jgi:large conductance mechanosensitive channel
MDPGKKVLSLAEEFKAFALKGNVVDLAIGVIIGAAFTKIVDSLVTNVLMPLINSVAPTGHTSYTTWAFEIRPGTPIPIGKFLGDIANFLLVALALFILVRKFLVWVMSLHRSEAVKETPPLTKDQELLSEIRDLMKNQAPPPPASPMAAGAKRKPT